MNGWLRWSPSPIGLSRALYGAASLSNHCRPPLSRCQAGMLNLGLILLLVMVAGARCAPMASYPWAAIQEPTCKDPYVNLPKDFVIGFDKCLHNILSKLCSNIGFPDNHDNGLSADSPPACRGNNCSPSCLRINYCGPPRWPTESVAQMGFGMAEKTDNLNSKLMRDNWSQASLMELTMDCRAKVRSIYGCHPISFQNTFKRLMFDRLPKEVSKVKEVSKHRKLTVVSVPVRQTNPRNYALVGN